MRLTPQQIARIRQITQQRLGTEVRVMVYGSRLLDGRRGGDLDLLLESSGHITLMQRAELKLALERDLNMPVDLLAYQRGRKPTAFQALALARAVPLDNAA